MLISSNHHIHNPSFVKCEWNHFPQIIVRVFLALYYFSQFHKILLFWEWVEVILCWTIIPGIWQEWLKNLRQSSCKEFFVQVEHNQIFTNTFNFFIFIFISEMKSMNFVGCQVYHQFLISIFSFGSKVKVKSLVLICRFCYSKYLKSFPFVR